MALHNELGKWGEDVAANLLKQKNYRIVQQNWRMGHLEVDIIAEDCQTIAFVEVKTRIGRQSAEQKSFQQEVGKLGFEYLVWRSLDDAIAFVGKLL